MRTITITVEDLEVVNPKDRVRSRKYDMFEVRWGRIAHEPCVRIIHDIMEMNLELDNLNRQTSPQPARPRVKRGV